MTDKQIIIDGINVSGCEHIDFDCTNCEIFANMCHENSNCCYKKYKRKEQILTEIKKIAEKKCLGCTNFCNDESIRFCVTKQILQKISEVEI